MLNPELKSNSKNTAIETIGWYGVLALLGAYTLLSFGILDGSNLWFQILNGTGAIAIVIDAVNQKNWQPAVLNIIWAIVALVALVKLSIQ